MIVATFDLSSACIGVTFAQIESNTRISFGNTLAVIPEPPTGKERGYTTNEPKKLQKGGSTYKGFLLPNEVLISKEEAERREREFKNFRHNRLLTNIGQQCGRYLSKIKPGMIAIEKNKSFNGILTTKLLAEIAGGIYFYCGAHDIPLYDWDESVIRAQIRRDIKDFSLANNEGKVAADTKWEIHCRLRSYFEQHHPGIFTFDNITMDESDSLAVFYYLYKNVIVEGKR